MGIIMAALIASDPTNIRRPYGRMGSIRLLFGNRTGNYEWWLEDCEEHGYADH